MLSGYFYGYAYSLLRILKACKKIVFSKTKSSTQKNYPLESFTCVVFLFFSGVATDTLPFALAH